MSLLLVRRYVTSILLLLLAAAAPSLLAKGDWADPDPADLAATASKDFPEADLEILFFHQNIDTSRGYTWNENHVQAKIYSAKGIERMSIFAIEHNTGFRARQLAGRLVKPDGTSFELAKDDFHETTVVKKGGAEILRTTFAFPNVQPGDIIEYRWHQPMPALFGSYHRFFCQAEVPTREYTFTVAAASSDFQVTWYNCWNVERKDRQVVIRNLPPFVEEPYMPAETGFRGWIMILFDHPFLRYYGNNDSWDLIGNYLAEDFRFNTAPNKAVRAQAEALVAGLPSSEQKLAKLYEFAQAEIKNLSWFDTAATAEAKKRREKEDSYQNPAKTLERRSGSAHDIDRFFAGLARAAGFEARLAMSASREDILDIRNPRGWIFTDRYSVAIKVRDKWKIYTPGRYLVPPGMLSTQDEGATFYICDEKKGWFELAPLGDAPLTQSRRSGKFVLDGEGTLTGEVEVQFTGQRAIRTKDRWWDLSDDEITKRVRETVVERLPAAEITEVTWENVRERAKPIVVRYNVTVPAYAETIGSRLAFTPNFFEANATEFFTAETRRYPILFDFAEQELDEIELVLPEGFVFDGASAPAAVGTKTDFISSQYNMKFAPQSRTLSYRREFTLGAGGSTQFRAESYAPMRRLFGRIHRSDTHQLVLKPNAAPEAPAATPVSAEAGE